VLVPLRRKKVQWLRKSVLKNLAEPENEATDESWDKKPRATAGYLRHRSGVAAQVGMKNFTYQ
jgi:hypothetical protein